LIDDELLLVRLHTHQVGPQATPDLSTVIQASRARRRQADGPDRLGQVVSFGIVRQPARRLEQAGWVVIAGQDIQHAVARQFRSGFDNMVREAELAEMEKKWAEENARIMREFPPEKVLPAPVSETPAPSEPTPVEPEDVPPAMTEPPAFKPGADETPASPATKEAP